MNESISGAKVAAKISEVSRLVGHVEKGGFNAHFKFAYQAWDDVLPAVKNACVIVGLVIAPNITDVIRSDGYVTVLTRFDCICTETGDTLSFTFAGESKQTDDKSIQKAMTSATKYLYLKLFQISVHGETDPDGAAPTVAKTPAAPPSNELRDWAAKLNEILGKETPKFEKACKDANVPWGAILKSLCENGNPTPDELYAELEKRAAAKATNGATK